MRILGVVLILVGFFISLTLIGAFLGIPLMILGLVLVAIGGRHKTVITNVIQVSNGPNAQEFRSSDVEVNRGNRSDRDFVPSRGEPKLVGSSRTTPVAPQITQAPEFDPVYEDENFTDVRNQISRGAKQVLALAKQQGFEIKARPTSITIVWDGGQEVFVSNDAIVEFGRAQGYQV